MFVSSNRTLMSMSVSKMLYRNHLFTLLLYKEAVNSTLCHFFLYCNVALIILYVM